MRELRIARWAVVLALAWLGVVLASAWIAARGAVDTDLFALLPSGDEVFLTRALRGGEQQITLLIRAPEAISALTEKEIEVRVDLTDVESARSLRKRVIISVPPGVIVVRSSPSEVDVVVPPRKND